METTVGPSLQARWFSLVIPNARRARLPDMLVMSSYVKSMEWSRPLADTSTPGLNATQEIVDRWNPFNKRDSSSSYMRELSSEYWWRLVVRSIPFPSPATWKRNPTIMCLRTGCLFTTTTLTRQPS